MKILVLDTSSIVQAAVVEPAKVLSVCSVESMQRHVEDVAPLAHKALQKANVGNPDAVVVGTGPGPFTGLRAGVIAGQMMAVAWSVPVYGIMSHYGFSAQGDYLTISDARRKEVYWCRFKDQTLVDGPHVGKKDALLSLTSYGFDNEPLYIDAGILGLKALFLLDQGKDLTSLTPYYLREADAKVPGPRKRVIR